MDCCILIPYGQYHLVRKTYVHRNKTQAMKLWDGSNTIMYCTMKLWDGSNTIMYCIVNPSKINYWWCKCLKWFLSFDIGDCLLSYLDSKQPSLGNLRTSHQLPLETRTMSHTNCSIVRSRLNLATMPGWISFTDLTGSLWSDLRTLAACIIRRQAWETMYMYYVKTRHPGIKVSTKLC